MDQNWEAEYYLGIDLSPVPDIDTIKERLDSAYKRLKNKSIPECYTDGTEKIVGRENQKGYE